MSAVRKPRAPSKGLGIERERRRRVARKLSGPSLAQCSHVLILGISQPAVMLQSELARTGIVSHRTASPRENDRAVDAQTRVVVIVPPIADLSVARYARQFRDAQHHIPVLVVTPGTVTVPGVFDLYQDGVQAVFQWPQDRQAVVRTAFRLAGNAARDTRLAEDADIALEELVNERLRTALTEFGPGLVAQVQAGLVVLTGEVDALWKLYVAEQVAADVPGVVEVNGNAVTVSGPTQSDGAIANAIRQVLSQARDVDPSTIALRVENGHVVLAGSTRDRHELERALQLVRHVRGVRDIDNWTTVSREAKREDQSVARSAERAVRMHHPEGNVQVAVFGGIGVLSGVVESAAERRALEQLVDGQVGVSRVVDKLEVRPN